MATVPTSEELKKLSPEERIKRLRLMEVQRKKDLEDTRKMVEEEIAAAEELIKETQDETEEEEDTARKREEVRKDERAEREERESLEERIVDAPSAPEQKQYGTNLYNSLEQAAGELNRLYGSPNWSEGDQAIYKQSKSEIERAQSYKLNSQRLEDDLGLASGILNKLKYRH